MQPTAWSEMHSSRSGPRIVLHAAWSTDAARHGAPERWWVVAVNLRRGQFFALAGSAALSTSRERYRHKHPSIKLEINLLMPAAVLQKKEKDAPEERYARRQPGGADREHNKWIQPLSAGMDCWLMREIRGAHKQVGLTSIKLQPKQTWDN